MKVTLGLLILLFCFPSFPQTGPGTAVPKPGVSSAPIGKAKVDDPGVSPASYDLNAKKSTEPGAEGEQLTEEESSVAFEKFYSNLKANSLQLNIFDKFIRPLNPSEVLKLQTNLKANPNSSNSRRFLGDHYYKNRNWQQVSQTLGFQPETLNENSLNQLFTAYFELQDFRGAGTVAVLLKALKKLSPISTIQIVDHQAVKIRNMKSAEQEDARDQLVLETIKLLSAQEELWPRKTLLYDRHLAFLEEFVTYFPQEGIQLLDRMSSLNILKKRHYSQACLYNYSSGYSKNALTSCNEALSRNSKDYRNRIWLGKTQLYSGQEQGGKRTLASVGNKHPEATAALEATAAHFKGEKNLAQAMSYYQRVIQRPDASAKAYLGLAEVAMDLKKYDTALMAFQRNCLMNKILSQEFRRASGLLKDNVKMRVRFRSAMRLCNNRKRPTLRR